MLFRKPLLLALAALLSTSTLFYACRKTDAPNNAIAVSGTGTVSGRVLDDNGNPVSGATIKAGTGSTQTDINGMFRISGVPVAENGLAYVRVEKTGFYPGSRTVDARGAAEIPVRIQLIPRTVVASFSGSSGGTAPLAAGGSIVFPANSFVNAASNSAYTGTVKVAAFTFDPTAANFNDIMPGSLMATRSDNSSTLLRSFSMVAVELSGSNGEKLQLAAGQTATISFPIPASLQGSAPATIPLWYFNEQEGVWKEEGSAQKQGAFYVGLVQHFSFWNCDLPQPYAQFRTRVLVKTDNTPVSVNPGTPMAGAQVVISDLTTGASGMGITDEGGYTSGAIPADHNLSLKVIDVCGALRYEANIGPFANGSNNETTATITNYTQPNTFVFSGTVSNCSGGVLASGYVMLNRNGQLTRAAVINGQYSISITSCEQSVSGTLTAGDFSSNQEGIPQQVVAHSGTPATTNLVSCGVSSEEYIQYTLNGSTHTATPSTDTVVAWTYPGNPTQTLIYGVPIGTAQSFAIAMEVHGDQAAGQHNLHTLDLMFNSQYYFSQDNGSVDITSFGGFYSFIIGTFQTTVRDSAGLNFYPVNGRFRIRRGN